MKHLLEYLLDSALVLWFALVLGTILLGFGSGVLWLRGEQLNSAGSGRRLLVLRRLIFILPVVILVLAVALSIYNTLTK
jgi:hypothetical protein